MWLFPFSFVSSVEITSSYQIVLTSCLSLLWSQRDNNDPHNVMNKDLNFSLFSSDYLPNVSYKISAAPTAECSWLLHGQILSFQFRLEHVWGGNGCLKLLSVFSGLLFLNYHYGTFCSRVLRLSLCLPVCLSERPCRICMVIEVITASSFYLRLISPRCFIPWVEAARNHFEDKLQQLMTPVQCSFSPCFFFPICATLLAVLLVFIQGRLDE